jgi:hypothetical protein
VRARAEESLGALPPRLRLARSEAGDSAYPVELSPELIALPGAP